MSPPIFANTVSRPARLAPTAPPRAVAAAAHHARLPPLLSLLLLSAALAVFSAGCAAGSRDPAVTSPRAGAPPYPVLLASSDERRAGAAANWLALAAGQDLPPQPELQPVTSTVRALPADVPATLRLPLVELGAGAGIDPEEATRESLRRFIAGARDLLGVDPEDLSLVETRTEADGSRSVRYLQKPFPYPLRNNFGLVDIRFAPDRRVLSLASTALPDTVRLAAALAALRPSLIPAADIPARLAGRSFDYAAPNATPQTFTPAAGDPVDVRELIVFPLRRPADAAAIEIHLAWEAIVGRGGTNLLVHLDAVTGEVISAVPTAETPRPAPAATPATPTPAPSPAPTLTATPRPPAAASPTRTAPPPATTPSPARPATATPAPTPSATAPPARPKTL